MNVFLVFSCPRDTDDTLKIKGYEHRCVKGTTVNVFKIFLEGRDRRLETDLIAQKKLQLK